jgi:hypothetical protein
MSNKKRSFCAGNHLAWWSIKYPSWTNKQIMDNDLEYMVWAVRTLKRLKFSNSIKEKVKRYEHNKQTS